MSTALVLKIIIPLLALGGAVTVLVFNEHPASAAAKPLTAHQLEMIDSLKTVKPTTTPMK
jgi:hypothetical protein